MGDYKLAAFSFSSSSYFGNTTKVDGRRQVAAACSVNYSSRRKKISAAGRSGEIESNENDSLFLESNTKHSRRSFLKQASLITVASLTVANGLPVSLFHSRSVAAEEEATTAFSTYKGPVSLGYSFTYPTQWTVKKKPIKTHLSEVIVTDANEGSTSAGIVVDAVKIDSIDKFGTPDIVGQKVVAVESKKESVKEAFVTSTAAMTKDGLTYYVIDYTVDSTRGLKRYFAKATITGGQLYVFTTQAKIDNYDQVEKTFSQMLDSFNVKKQYL